jgi:hypothetical protein
VEAQVHRLGAGRSAQDDEEPVGHDHRPIVLGQHHHAAAEICALDARQVERGPPAVGSVGGRVAGLDLPDPTPPAARLDADPVAAAEGTAAQRAGHDRAPAADGEHPVDAKTRRPFPSGDPGADGGVQRSQRGAEVIESFAVGRRDRHDRGAGECRAVEDRRDR